tara:strand:- start:46 stop:249 length:204 start_codon:yes stop_codon:yes gene_type:complete
MCSLLYQECIPEFTDEDRVHFNNYSDCQIYGNRVSIDILDSLGEEVDKSKIKIFFRCEGIEEKEIQL